MPLSNGQRASGIVFPAPFSASATMSISSIVVQLDGGIPSRVSSRRLLHWELLCRLREPPRVDGRPLGLGVGKPIGVLPVWIARLGCLMNPIMLLSTPFDWALSLLFRTLTVSVVMWTYSRRFALARLTRVAVRAEGDVGSNGLPPCGTLYPVDLHALARTRCAEEDS